MFVRVRDLISTTQLLPLVFAGSCLPVVFSGAVSIIGNAVRDEDLPSTYAGGPSTGGLVLGAIILLLLCGVQVIPWKYLQRYRRLKAEDPDQLVMGELSLKTALGLGVFFYVGSAALLGAILILAT